MRDDKRLHLHVQICIHYVADHNACRSKPCKMGVLAIGMHISTFAIASLVTQDGLAVVGNWVLNDLLYVAFA